MINKLETILRELEAMRPKFRQKSLGKEFVNYVEAKNNIKNAIKLLKKTT